MKGLTVLGATGSIGVSTLDVVGRHPERFRVHALTAHSNVERLAEQCRVHRPACAVVPDAAAASALRDRLADVAVEIMHGPEALASVAAAPEVDYVMAAIVGSPGLLPTLAAARAGKCVLLANKEALVMAGALFMEAVHAHGAVLLPIDSEHNAIFQCLPVDAAGRPVPLGVRRILLTASGGPFRTRPLETLAAVTPAEAVRHPNWSMGRKISVDSATMMNKGLELIEAHWLFAAAPEALEVLIHPQSVVHSMVEYVDGSVLAQLGNPDMRTPIAHALAWPERVTSGVSPLDLCAIGRLDFEAPDERRFPCLPLAREALARGGSAAAVLNAANEVAVAAFLEGRLAYLGIADVIAETLARCDCADARSLGALLAADAEARRRADESLSRLAA